MAPAIALQKEKTSHAMPGSLGVNVLQATNMPRSNFLTSGFCILIQAFEGEEYTTGKKLGMAATTLTSPELEQEDMSKPFSWVIEWNTIVSLPCQEGIMQSDSDVLPSDWNIDKAKLLISLCDQNKLGGMPLVAGSVVVSLGELLESGELWLSLFDEKGDALCASGGNYKPCKLKVCLQTETIPRTWATKVLTAAPPSSSYPRHVFMMTRGTRGDVQPFVTLARGLAEQLGYLVTICTEMRWKSFVMQWSNVKNGKIRFRPSGGDTEGQMSDPVAQFVTMAKSELFQMLIMANTEANFFRSATVFLDHVEEYEDSTERPVDSIIFGLTVAGIALMIGELLEKPIVGFVLQPSCIPSTEKDWHAVQSIYSHHLSLVDVVEEQLFTGHGTLTTLKSMFENSLFDKWSLNAIRRKFGLQAINTYEQLHHRNIPLIIPMKKDTFSRPHDWWSNINLTDFIFLREPAVPGQIRSLGEPLDSFVAKARSEGRKIGLMTFSSMRVPRATVFKVLVKMVTECNFNLNMIYVGKEFPDPIPVEVQTKADELIEDQRMVILERADFGELFKHSDFFIIQGGLGTTVEAGRVKKPVVVSGPLLLDQRFWGDVCFKKGIGPPPCHIDGFEDICVDFANCSLDPVDPKGWQDNARKANWGNVDDDGVKNNVDAFHIFLETKYEPVRCQTNLIGINEGDISIGVENTTIIDIDGRMKDTHSSSYVVDARDSKLVDTSLMQSIICAPSSRPRELAK